MNPRRRIIPIFVPHLGCPNDCVFCNQRKISGSLVPADGDTVRRTLEEARNYTPAGAELAFYGGSFTAIPAEQQRELLEAARPYMKEGFVAEIRVSTRPDRIDPEALTLLAEYGVKTVELGAQSMDEKVLRMSGRGHTAEDTRRAAALIKASGFRLMLQMMTGLPGSSPESDIMTARELIKLGPDGVRIYPTVIIRETALYELWRAGKYREHTVEDAVSVCAELVKEFGAAKVPIIRLGLNPTDDLSAGEAAAGAYHPALGELVYSRVYLQKAEELIEKSGCRGSVSLGVHPSRVSLMTGQKRRNIESLKAKFGLEEVRVVKSPVNDGEIVILP
ncbi:MAG: radical SAM protein [Clostridiales bacterium]|nr:radical SAM protein [Clostridiales bacterium]